MKVFKIGKPLKIICFVVSMFLCIGAIGIIKEVNNSFIFRFFGIFAFLFFLLGMPAVFLIKVQTDDEKVSIFGVDWKYLYRNKKFRLKSVDIFWHDIEEFECFYLVFEWFTFIRFKPKLETGGRVRDLANMPIELIQDIIYHLPKETKITLYPYIERKLK